MLTKEHEVKPAHRFAEATFQPSGASKLGARARWNQCKLGCSSDLRPRNHRLALVVKPAAENHFENPMRFLAHPLAGGLNAQPVRTDCKLAFLDKKGLQRRHSLRQQLIFQ